MVTTLQFWGIGIAYLCYYRLYPNILLTVIQNEIVELDDNLE